MRDGSRKIKNFIKDAHIAEISIPGYDPSSPTVQWSSGAGVALAARQLFKYVSKVINQDADLIIPSSAAPAATDPHCGLARLVPAGLNAVILYKFSSPRLRPRCSSCLLPPPF